MGVPGSLIEAGGVADTEGGDIVGLERPGAPLPPPAAPRSIFMPYPFPLATVGVGACACVAIGAAPIPRCRPVDIGGFDVAGAAKRLARSLVVPDPDVEVWDEEKSSKSMRESPAAAFETSAGIGFAAAT